MTSDQAIALDKVPQRLLVIGAGDIGRRLLARLVDPGDRRYEALALVRRADAVASLAALLAGDVDMIDAVPTQDATRLKSNRNFALAQKVSWRTLFFHLDQARDKSPFVTDKAGKPLERNPLKDARVRGLAGSALDKTAQTLIESAGGVFGSVIVQDGKILAEGANRVVAENDPTWHGEIEAILALDD